MCVLPLTLLGCTDTAAAGRSESVTSPEPAAASASSPTAVPTTATALPPAPDEINASAEVDDRDWATDDVTAAGADLATAVMTAYVRTDLSQDEWWKQLESYFTPEAQALFETVPVEAVTASRVDGTNPGLMSTANWTLTYGVQTNTGQYRVEIVQTGDTPENDARLHEHSWDQYRLKVAYIHPPEDR